VVCSLFGTSPASCAVRTPHVWRLPTVDRRIFKETPLIVSVFLGRHEIDFIQPESPITYEFPRLTSIVSSPYSNRMKQSPSSEPFTLSLVLHALSERALVNRPARASCPALPSVGSRTVNTSKRTQEASENKASASQVTRESQATSSLSRRLPSWVPIKLKTSKRTQ
jgi:hypothetical protein